MLLTLTTISEIFLQGCIRALVDRSALISHDLVFVHKSKTGLISSQHRPAVVEQATEECVDNLSQAELAFLNTSTLTANEPVVDLLQRDDILNLGVASGGLTLEMAANDLCTSYPYPILRDVGPVELIYNEQ